MTTAERLLREAVAYLHTDEEAARRGGFEVVAANRADLRLRIDAYLASIEAKESAAAREADGVAAIPSAEVTTKEQSAAPTVPEDTVCDDLKLLAEKWERLGRKDDALFIGMAAKFIDKDDKCRTLRSLLAQRDGRIKELALWRKGTEGDYPFDP